MQTQRLAGYSLVLILGFTAGWFTRPLSTPDSIVTSADSLNASSSLSSDAADVPTRLVHREPSKDILAITPKADHNSDKSTQPNRITSFEEYLDFLQNKDEYEITRHPELLARLQENSEFVEQLLTGYLDANDEETKRKLRMTVAMLNDSPIIEQSILDKMRSGNNVSDWLGLLSNLGVRQESSLQFISDQMPQLYEEQDIISSIGAFSNNPMWSYHPISRDLRDQISGQIAQYAESTSPKMRMAVLDSLASFPLEKSEALLIEALNDPSEDIRGTALSVMWGSTIQSEQLKTHLLRTVENDTRSLGVRSMAYYALSQYELEGSDYDKVRDIGLRIREATLELERATQ